MKRKLARGRAGSTPGAPACAPVQLPPDIAGERESPRTGRQAAPLACPSALCERTLYIVNDHTDSECPCRFVHVHSTLPNGQGRPQRGRAALSSQHPARLSRLGYGRPLTGGSVKSLGPAAAGPDARRWGADHSCINSTQLNSTQLNAARRHPPRLSRRKRATSHPSC